jgi:hypothetical protein
LNVAAFLMSGIVARHPQTIGEPYRDRDGRLFHPMSIQPVLVLVADAAGLANAARRAREQDVEMSAFIEDMFATGHDEANRAVFAAFGADDAKLVGLGFRAMKKTADKISKGARMYA